MIKLVTNRTGEKAFCFDHLLFPKTVLIDNGYLHGTGNDTAFSTDGKTTFPARLLPFLLHDDGVDKFKIPLVDVHYRQAAKYPHLRCGKSCPLFLFNRFLHIFQKSMELFVKLLDGKPFLS